MYNEETTEIISEVPIDTPAYDTSTIENKLEEISMNQQYQYSASMIFIAGVVVVFVIYLLYRFINSFFEF